jgi:hypothetical protein
VTASAILDQEEDFDDSYIVVLVAKGRVRLIPAVEGDPAADADIRRGRSLRRQLSSRFLEHRCDLLQVAQGFNTGCPCSAPRVKTLAAATNQIAPAVRETNSLSSACASVGSSAARNDQPLATRLQKLAFDGLCSRIRSCG